MALFILQPDAQGNCCECTGRTEPCDSCGGGCGVCVTECMSIGDIVVSRIPCVIQRGVAGTECHTFNTNGDIGGECGVQSLQQTARVRLVITELTPDIETHAFVYFSDNTNHEFVFTPTSDIYITEYVDVPFPALNEDIISVTGCAVACPLTCALPVPPLGNPYPDYQSAEDVITGTGTNSHERAICYGFVDAFSESSVLAGYTIDTDTPNRAFINVTLSSGLALDSWISITCEASPITVAYGLTVTSCVGNNYSAAAILYDAETGTQIDIDNAATNSGNLTVIAPQSGTYYLKMVFTAGVTAPGSCGLLLTSTVSSGSNRMILNPAIVRYDDNGTTRQLETCPKLLLPLFTEATGNWYDNLSEAQSAIAASINCLSVSYDPGQGGSYGSLSANASFNSLALVGSYTNGGEAPFSSVGMYGSVSLAGAGSLNVDFVFPASSSYGLDVRDENGNLVYSQSFSGGSNATITVPGLSPGKYLIFCITTASVGPGGTNTSVFTASAIGTTLTANLVQALYDVGLDCPGRLDC